MTENLFRDDGKPDFTYRKCNTIEELAQYLKELFEYEKHDYNTSGYAITKALLATEMLVGHVLGTTDFQHGYARLAFMQQSMGSKLGIGIIDFDKILYPQYDILAKVEKWIVEMKKSPKLINRAKELITEDDKEQGFMKAHPDVRARWEELVAEVATS